MPVFRSTGFGRRGQRLVDSQSDRFGRGAAAGTGGTGGCGGAGRASVRLDSAEQMAERGSHRRFPGPLDSVPAGEPAPDDRLLALVVFTRGVAPRNFRDAVSGLCPAQVRDGGNTAMWVASGLPIRPEAANLTGHLVSLLPAFVAPRSTYPLGFPGRTCVCFTFSISRMTIIKTSTSYFACPSPATTAANLSSIWFQPST